MQLLSYQVEYVAFERAKQTSKSDRASRLKNNFHAQVFILLINIKMPTMVGILLFISNTNAVSERFTAIKDDIFQSQ